MLRNSILIAIVFNMIKAFKHKGLRKFFESGNKAGINPNHAPRLKLILQALHTATCIEDMYLPGFRTHKLEGTLKDQYSVWVTGNWRVFFRFQDGDAYIVDYDDYH